MRIFLGWIAALAFTAALAIGGLVGGILGGIQFGFYCLYLWVIGDIRDVNEYYESETPNWMIWFAGSSSEKKDFSWLYRPSFWKLTSLMLVGCAVLGCGIAWALRDSDAFLAFLICVVAIWLIGVLLVERHFRRHYTPKQTS